jgi:hypothetical protein
MSLLACLSAKSSSLSLRIPGVTHALLSKMMTP